DGPWIFRGRCSACGAPAQSTHGAWSHARWPRRSRGREPFYDLAHRAWREQPDGLRPPPARDGAWYDARLPVRRGGEIRVLSPGAARRAVRLAGSGDGLCAPQPLAARLPLADRACRGDPAARCARGLRRRARFDRHQPASLGAGGGGGSHGGLRFPSSRRGRLPRHARRPADHLPQPDRRAHPLRRGAHHGPNEQRWEPAM
ncbi:MAG: Transcriptional regulator, Xre-family with cupin domain, partial [uncultured Rubrobacteraceae bacterium]